MGWPAGTGQDTVSCAIDGCNSSCSRELLARCTSENDDAQGIRVRWAA